MDLGLYKYHILWERVIIFVPYEQIDHMQHIPMNLGNTSLTLIITERHVVLQKIWIISRKTEKNKVKK